MKIEEIVYIYKAPITKDIRKGRSNAPPYFLGRLFQADAWLHL